MLEARPDRPFWGRTWVESAFSAHLRKPADPDLEGGLGPAFFPEPTAATAHNLAGWSVGGCMGAETLVQSRPVARATDDPVGDLLRAKARCSLGIYHPTWRTELANQSPQIARFQRWMAVLAGPRLRERSRADILRELPAFLSRDAARESDAQIQLLALLDQLYTATGFQHAFAEPRALADALASYADSRGDEAPHALFVSDGRTLAVLLNQGCLLSSHPPAAVRPAGGLVASSPGHLPASLWIWNPDPPDQPPRDAERVAEGIFTIHAAEPGVVSRR